MRVVLLCFSHQDASINVQCDLLRSPRDLDLRSSFDLDLSRSCYTCFDASWRGKHDGVKIIALSFQKRKLSKNCFAQKCRFWPFVTSDNLTVNLSWNLTSPQRKSVSRAFYWFFKFWCSCYRDRDNAHNMKPCHVIRKFGKVLPLMTSGDLNCDLT